jgi:hypothetical protein
MSNAAQMRPGSYTNITMRQSFGMIGLFGLIAGLLPFVSNWFLALRFGAPLPLARAAQASTTLQPDFVQLTQWIPGLNSAALTDFYRILAGQEQAMAGWLTALLSSLAYWVQWPVSWFTLWIVYGALVAVMNRSMGATPTLQRFFAATGYAAVPLALLGLSILPCVGWLIGLVSILWAVAIYVRANQEITGLEPVRALAASLLPAGLMVVLGLFMVGALLIGGSIILL